MSSTNRGAPRSEHDYYVTPIPEIEKFLFAWQRELAATEGVPLPMSILDPCAGGNREKITIVRPSKEKKDKKTGKWVTITPPALVIPPTPCSYPMAFRRIEHIHPVSMATMDIREDSMADHRGFDFLNEDASRAFPGVAFDAVISNPPFALAAEFVIQGLKMVISGGYVVMLLRLNFLGSEERNEWLMAHPPKWIFVHSKRMSFTPDNKTDSIEYAHFIWQAGFRPFGSKTIVLPYRTTTEQQQASLL